MDSEAVPEGRCGFVRQPADVGQEVFYEADSDTWYKKSQAVCCWRETWNDTGQCIWHAEVDGKSVAELVEVRTTKEECLDGAYLFGVQAGNAISFGGCSLLGGDLRDADLGDADLTNAALRGADLTDAYLGDADLKDTDLFDADLTAAVLVDADLTAADLGHADLTAAALRRADLESTSLVDADLEGADLEDASLVQTDLRRADLQNAKLYQTYFSDIRINSDTDFGDTCVYETPEELDDDWEDWWDATSTEAAVWTYRRLQDLHEKYALTEDARNYHIRKEEAEKKRHKEEGNYAKWAIYAGNGLVSKHGESPWRVVGVSGIVIAIWSVLYLLSGIRVPDDFSGTETIGLELFSGIPVPTPFGGTLVSALDQIATSIYFSVVTFTTLGYGDLQPATGFAQALATVESFLGALLMAYLVFVLGRRTNW